MKAILLFICLTPNFLTAQHDPFAGTPVEGRYAELSETLEAYEVYAIDLAELSTFVQSERFDDHITLSLPGYGDFEIDLFHHRLKGEDYNILVQTESGVETIPDDGVTKTFRGYLEGGQYEVRLTIDKDFINGFIELPKDELYFESVRFRHAGASSDHVLVYKKSSITEEFRFDCEPLQVPVANHNAEPENSDQRVAGECLEVQIGLADDWLMYLERNENLADVENHNLTVINNLQANFDDEFADEYVFIVIQIFVSTCNSCDPWPTSTNPSTLLNSFGNWAGSGFSFAHDVGSLWSDRNFDGSTVGLAWLDAVCINTFKYNVLQDFTGNANFLRVLQAHELGHNFGTGHDPAGSGTIMAPVLNNSNTWSTSSINQIDGYMGGVGCLSICASGQPPVASIGSDLQEGCSPLTIEFSDLSTGAPDSWSWVFDGGNPGTSNLQNPVITYQNPGTYDVQLEVFNAVGSDLIILADYVTVLPDAEADFTFSWDELTVFFTNLSINADSYFWEFGDGLTSTETDPTHTYSDDGFYDVTLTATNECGSITYQVVIEVVSVPIAEFSFGPETGCVPLIVDFTNFSSDNVDDYLWEFPGGDPSSSTQANPVVIYNNPGTYSVTLTVFNEAGEDALSVLDAIIVDPMPFADFDALVAGSNADFDNLSENAYAYFWDFGDGQSSTEVNPSHMYLNGGIYTVMLISENDCGSDTAFLEISVSSAPLAGVGVSQSLGCAPFQVEYSSASSGDVDTYAWTFVGGNPATSSEMSPVVTYNAPGTYDAELIVTNAIGSDTLTVTAAVVVQDPVLGAFSFDVNGNSVDFINESTGNDTYEWEIAGITYQEENPSIVFSEDGDYIAQLIVTGPCGSDTVIQTFTISTPPVAGLGTSATVGCEPFEVQFSDESSSNVLAWEWSFPGGTPVTSSVQNPLVSYNEPGVYSVSLTVTNSAGMDILAMDNLITVDPLPEAIFGTLQSGTEVEFENSSVDATTYLWLFGDGDTSMEENPVHDFGEFGQYEIQLIATNNCGSDTSVISLQLAALPVPWFTANETFGCAPFEVEFNDESQNGAEQWDWTFPGGTPDVSTDQNPVVVYDAPGVYDITLKVSNAAGAQSLVREEYVVVGEEPVSEFTGEADALEVTFTNISIDADSYFWDFGDGATDTLENPVHLYLETGTYEVVLIATNSCGSDTFSIEVVIQTSGINDPELDIHVDIWPNPNSGTYSVDIQNLTGEVELSMVDITGRTVYQTILDAPAQVAISLDARIAPGLYHVVIMGKDVREVIKVVVQR